MPFTTERFDVKRDEVEAVGFHFIQVADVAGLLKKKVVYDPRFLHYLVELEAAGLPVTVLCETTKELSQSKLPNDFDRMIVAALVPVEVMPGWLHRHRMILHDLTQPWSELDKLIVLRGGPEIS